MDGNGGASYHASRSLHLTRRRTLSPDRHHPRKESYEHPASLHSVSRRRALQALGALGASLLAGLTQTAWPTRPVKVISFPPGGSSDFVGRTLAPFLAEQLGQPFVVVLAGCASESQRSSAF